MIDESIFMGLKHLFIGKERFDEKMKPWKTPWYLMGVVGLVELFYKMTAKCKIKKNNMDGLKTPYLILQNHASFVDFGLTWSLMYPKRINWVCSIEEFTLNEWLMRSLGCFSKRKFTPDIQVIKHIIYCLKELKHPVAIFPEARFSFAGITEELDEYNYARLIKVLKVPVVAGVGKGVFIRSPQWAKRPYKDMPVEAEFTLIVTEEETKTLSEEEIANRIKNALQHDDYKYWQESGRRVKSKVRAENLHKVLYQCPHCKKEFTTTSKGTKIWCTDCGHEWELTEYGYLKSTNGETYFEHVPDWYRWQRQNVIQEVEEGRYSLKDTARLEWLKSSRAKFVPLGKVEFTHDYNGITLKGTLDDGSEFYSSRPVESQKSCHVEFDYKGRGDAIDFVTLDKQHETYFVFPENLKNVLTKINFATEALYYREEGLKKQQSEKSE